MFLEEDLPLEILVNMTEDDDYSVDIVTTSNGNEYRRLNHNLPRVQQEIGYLMLRDDMRTKVQNLFDRAFGRAAGFRVLVLDDNTTAADGTSAPSPTDGTLALISAGVYQITKQYGKDKAPLSIGYPTRRILKPVAASVRVAISGVEVTNVGATRWTLDATTGQVTFAANNTKSITAITQASSAVLTVGGSHGYTVGDTVYISGVVGMTQINGLRGAVTAIGGTTITVAINSTAFSAYSSGGTVNTRPQTGEAATAGCEFKYPMRFNSPMQKTFIDGRVREVSLSIIELLNTD